MGEPVTDAASGPVSEARRPTLRERLRAAVPHVPVPRAGSVRRTVGVALLVAAALLAHSNLLPVREVRAATERQLRQQERVNGQLRSRLENLARESNRLRRDPWTNERIIRDRYRMSRPAEVIVR